MTAFLVELTDYERSLARHVGKARHRASRSRRDRDAHGLKADDAASLELNIEGAAGELAVAKALNRYWHGSVDTFKEVPDVGVNIEVRTSADPRASLIVREDDPDSRSYILVTGTSLTGFKLHGWIRGREAKHPAWLKDPGSREPAYFVPQRELRQFHPLRLHAHH